jgi:hypothetical protein
MVDWVVGVWFASSFSRVVSSACKAEMRALRMLSSESALGFGVSFGIGVDVGVGIPQCTPPKLTTCTIDTTHHVLRILTHCDHG